MEIEKGIVCPLCGGVLQIDDYFSNKIRKKSDKTSFLVINCIGTCQNCKEIVGYEKIFSLGKPTFEIIDHYKK